MGLFNTEYDIHASFNLGAFLIVLHIKSEIGLQAFAYRTPGYETCVVPATGTVDLDIEGHKVAALGNRGEDVWDGEPEGTYVPAGAHVDMVCVSDAAEVFVAGAKYDKVLDPFTVRSAELDKVQY
ncbi:MAG: hypothetical protein HKN09_09950, partial [Saprospiraceae bacterium]|nr:hypothetical protein [Saprospiraceae bacterium]